MRRHQKAKAAHTARRANTKTKRARTTARYAPEAMCARSTRLHLVLVLVLVLVLGLRLAFWGVGVGVRVCSAPPWRCLLGILFHSNKCHIHWRSSAAASSPPSLLGSPASRGCQWGRRCHSRTRGGRRSRHRTRTRQGTSANTLGSIAQQTSHRQFQQSMQKESRPGAPLAQSGRCRCRPE